MSLINQLKDQPEETQDRFRKFYLDTYQDSNLVNFLESLMMLPVIVSNSSATKIFAVAMMVSVFIYGLVCMFQFRHKLAKEFGFAFDYKPFVISTLFSIMLILMMALNVVPVLVALLVIFINTAASIGRWAIRNYWPSVMERY